MFITESQCKLVFAYDDMGKAYLDSGHCAYGETSCVALRGLSGGVDLHPPRRTLATAENDVCMFDDLFRLYVLLYGTISARCSVCGSAVGADNAKISTRALIARLGVLN